MATTKTKNAGVGVTVTAAQIPMILGSIAEANRNLPPNQQLVPYLMSAPGVGKSSTVAAFAEKTGRHFTDIRLAYSAPTDVRGFPIVEDAVDSSGQPTGKKLMNFAHPAEFPTKPGGVLMLDEFSCAARQTQVAALQLVLDKKVGDYVVPDDTLIVLAGNRPQDRAHTERLSSAVVNRIIQITVEVNLDAWVNYAFDVGADARVIAFLKFRPDLLSDFNGSEWNGDDGFGSPRSWMMISNLLKSPSTDALPYNLRTTLFQGTVGPAAGIQFGAFIKNYESLPDVDKMLKDPDNAVMPTEPSVMWALVAAIAPRADVKNIGNVLKLTDRMRKEFQVLCVKLVVKRDKAVLATPEGSEWLASNAKDLA